VKLIDWQLLVTHVIAFLLVLFLLRRFAWTPVLRFLDQRRERIRAEFAEAERRQREADALRLEYETHLKRIELESRQRLQEAVAEGNVAAARIREQAQEERRLRLERADEEVRHLTDVAREGLRRRTVEVALQAAERAIQRELDDPAHRRLIEAFVDELEAQPAKPPGA
jgi:F-type H+-transporting ATPase subunit b